MKKFQNENMVASREVYFHTSTSWLLLLFSGIKWVIGVYRGWGLLGLDHPPLWSSEIYGFQGVSGPEASWNKIKLPMEKIPESRGIF